MSILAQALGAQGGAGEGVALGLRGGAVVEVPAAAPAGAGAAAHGALGAVHPIALPLLGEQGGEGEGEEKEHQ